MIHFIVNKTARTGRGGRVWAQVEARLRAEGVAYRAYETQGPGHATRLAGEISRLPGEAVFLVVLGGDGTLNEVINGVADFSRLRLGLIPTGSGNDFARGLGLPRRDSLGALEGILETVRGERPLRSIDLGQVWWGPGEGRRFAISAGLGLDALVCKRALTSRVKKVLNRLGLGKLTYLILTLQALFTMDTVSAQVTLDGGEVRWDRLIFSAAMNLPAEGGGVPMAPQARPDDGRLTLSAAHGVARWKTFFLLPFLVAGRHQGLGCFSIRGFRESQVTLSAPAVLHADGEYCGDVTWARFQCLPGLLRVMGR